MTIPIGPYSNDVIQAVRTLKQLSDEFAKAAKPNEGDKALKHIYLRTIVSDPMTGAHTLTVERGGLFHPIQFISRLVDRDSYRIAVLDKKGNFDEHFSTFEQLSKLHNAIGQITEEELKQVLTQMNVKPVDVAAVAQNIKDTVGKLNKVLDIIEKKKEKPVADKEKVQREFTKLMLHFKGAPVQITAPETVPDLLEHVELQRDTAKAEAEKAKVALVHTQSATNLTSALGAAKEARLSAEVAQKAATTAKEDVEKADSLLKKEAIQKEEEPSVHTLHQLQQAVNQMGEADEHALDAAKSANLASAEAAKKESLDRLEEAKRLELLEVFTGITSELETHKVGAETALIHLSNMEKEDPETALAHAATEEKVTAELERKARALLAGARKEYQLNQKEYLREPFKQVEELTNAIVRLATEVHTLHEKAKTRYEKSEVNSLMGIAVDEPVVTTIKENKEAEAEDEQEPVAPPAIQQEAIVTTNFEAVLPTTTTPNEPPKYEAALVLAKEIGFWPFVSLIDKYEKAGKDPSFDPAIVRMKARLTEASDAIDKSQIIGKLKIIQAKCASSNTHPTVIEPLKKYLDSLIEKPATFLTVAYRRHPEMKSEQAIQFELDDLAKKVDQVLASKNGSIETLGGVNLPHEELEERVGAFLEKHKGKPILTMQTVYTAGQFSSLDIERDLREGLVLNRMRGQLLDPAAKIVQNPGRTEQTLQAANTGLQVMQARLTDAKKMVDLTDHLIDYLESLPAGSDDLAHELLGQLQVIGRNLLILRVGTSTSYQQVQDILRERFANFLELEANAPIKARVLSANHPYLSALFGDKTAYNTVAEKVKQAPQTAAVSQPLPQAPKELTVKDCLRLYQNEVMSTLEIDLSKQRDVAIKGVLEARLKPFLENFEKNEKTTVSVTSWFWGTYDKEIPSQYAEDNSGTLARALYVDTYNALDAFKFDDVATNPKTIDRLGRLLTYASYIGSDSNEAHKALGLVRLFELVHKSDEVLRHQFDVTDNQVIKKCYSLLGVSGDPDEFLFSKDQLNIITTEQLQNLCDQIISEIRSIDEVNDWKSFITVVVDEDAITRSRSFSDLSDELISYLGTLY